MRRTKDLRGEGPEASGTRGGGRGRWVDRKQMQKVISLTWSRKEIVSPEQTEQVGDQGGGPDRAGPGRPR